MDAIPMAALPAQLEPRRLAVRALQVVALMAALGLAVALAPGFGDVGATLGDAQPGWLVLAVAPEALSRARPRPSAARASIAAHGPRR